MFRALDKQSHHRQIARSLSKGERTCARSCGRHRHVSDRAFPLALLGEGVQAAVLCQPTLPFNALFMRPIGAQRRVLGLASPDLDRAVKSRIAVLAMRYRNDPLCPAERFRTLRENFSRAFGADRNRG